MNLLVISLAGIGDTLFATPLIHELRANFPGANIDALVLWPGARDVLAGNPHLNTVYQKNLIKAGNLRSLRFLGSLGRNRYDISINTHPQSRIHYRFVARVINATTRISHEYDQFSPFDRLLVNRTLPQDYARHSIENNLALLPLIGGRSIAPTHEYEIYLSREERAWADAFIDAQNLGHRRLMGMHVGSGGTKNLALRRWPLDFYLELMTQLNRSHPELAILLFGGPEEEQDNARLLAATSRTAVFHPKTPSLRHAAAVLGKCDLFLSVDTALMHVAAAMKVRKQIVIETPTWNKPIEPYGNPFVLVKNPAVAGRNLRYYRYDGHGIRGSAEELIRCMRSVSVEAVYDTVMTAMRSLP